MTQNMQRERQKIRNYPVMGLNDFLKNHSTPIIYITLSAPIPHYATVQHKRATTSQCAQMPEN